MTNEDRAPPPVDSRPLNLSSHPHVCRNRHSDCLKKPVAGRFDWRLSTVCGKIRYVLGQAFLGRLAIAGVILFCAGLTKAQSTVPSASPGSPQTQPDVIKMQLQGHFLVVSPQLICVTYSDKEPDSPVAFYRGLGPTMPIRQSDFASIQQHHSDDWVIGKTPWRVGPKFERCVAYLPNVDYVILGNNELTLRYLTMEHRTAVDVVVTDPTEVRKVRRRFPSE
jgi:hypothetical protein